VPAPLESIGRRAGCLLDVETIFEADAPPSGEAQPEAADVFGRVGAPEIGDMEPPVRDERSSGARI
jgi:hypothetical protein